VLGPIPDRWGDCRVDVDEDVSHVVSTAILVIRNTRTASWLLLVTLHIISKDCILVQVDVVAYLEPTLTTGLAATFPLRLRKHDSPACWKIWYVEAKVCEELGIGDQSGSAVGRYIVLGAKGWVEKDRTKAGLRLCFALAGNTRRSFQLSLNRDGRWEKKFERKLWCEFKMFERASII